MEPNARSWPHILTNGLQNRGVADAEKSVTVGPIAPCGKPQEHQAETPAPVHFPEQALTARDQADSSVQHKEQTPSQVEDELSTDHGMLDNPLMVVEGEGMEMSKCNLKHPFRAKQVNT
jgi:hypothetical protein